MMYKMLYAGCNVVQIFRVLDISLVHISELYPDPTQTKQKKEAGCHYQGVKKGVRLVIIFLLCFFFFDKKQLYRLAATS